MYTLTIKIDKALIIIAAIVFTLLVTAMFTYIEAHAMLIRAVDMCTTTNIKPWWNP